MNNINTTLGNCFVTGGWGFKIVTDTARYTVWRAAPINNGNLPQKWIGYICAEGLFYRVVGWASEKDSAPLQWRVDALIHNPHTLDLGLHLSELVYNNLAPKIHLASYDSIFWRPS